MLGQGFCILYWLSTANPVGRKQQSAAAGCRNEHTVLTITHLVNLPMEANVYRVGPLVQKSDSLANGTNKSKRMSLIV
jgi:hypothetical protein